MWFSQRRFLAGSSLLRAVWLLSCFLCGKVGACPYSIRQVGFVVLEYKPYHVYYFVKDNTPGRERLTALLPTVSAEVLENCNVEAEVVNVDRQKSHPARSYFGSLGLKDLPRAVLASPQNEMMVLPKTDPLSEESLRRQLESLVSSPKREEIKRHIVRDWCVVMLIEGEDPKGNQRAARAVTTAIKKITGALTDMGTVVKRGPHLLRVSPKAEEEKVLLWSLGLSDKAERRARVVVLFGRGRQIGPTLRGGNLSAESVLSILHTIGKNCACTTDLRLLSGRWLPLRWERTLQAQVREELGFDPDSPRVKLDLAAIGSAADVPEACTQGALGYFEGYMEYLEEGEGETESAPPLIDLSSVNAAPAGAPPTLERRAGRVVLATLAPMFLLVLIGSVLLLLRRRRS